MARRRYQRGRLFLRGKKMEVWVGRWREDEVRDGRLVRVERSRVLGTRSTLPTRKLALRALEQAVSKVNSPDYRPLRDARFKDFACRWLSTVATQHKPSTRESERSQAENHLIPFFGELRLADVAPEVVQRFVSQSKAAPKTVRNCVYLLRLIWRSARAWGYVNHDALAGITLPGKSLVEPRFFTLDEIRKILNAAPEPEQTFFWIAAETGMRSGEICGLRPKDIAVAAVTVRRSLWRGIPGEPKTEHSVRQFSISEELAEHLAGFSCGLSDDSLLFVRADGRPWDTNYANKRKLFPLLRELGIAHGGTHAFRHGNATLMESINATMRVRQQRLGHSRAATTLHYTHAVESEESRVAAEIGRLLRPDALKNGRNN